MEDEAAAKSGAVKIPRTPAEKETTKRLIVVLVQASLETVKTKTVCAVFQRPRVPCAPLSQRRTSPRRRGRGMRC